MAEPYGIMYEMRGFDQLERMFDAARVVPQVKHELNLLLLSEVQMAVVRAQAMCPSKRIRATIGIIERNEDELWIWSGVHGGNLGQFPRELEFGNSRMHARPYWRPPIWEAFFRMMRGAKKIMERAFRG